MSDMSEAPSTDDIENAKPLLEPADENYRLLSNIPVRLSVELGSTSKKLSEIMAFQDGEVVELDRQADDLLDILVNGALVAKGEVVTIDGRYGVKIMELVNSPSGFPAIERR